MQHERAKPERLSLLYTAARLYYDQGLSQEEVAQQLNVSRSTVSRLLQRAREHDLVRIEVRAPSHPEELAARLADALELERALVIEPTPEPAARRALAAPVGRLLTTLGLVPGSILALGWGRTIWDVVQTGLPSLPGVIVVPIIGGLNEIAPHFQTNEIVRQAAISCGGKPHFIHAPALPSEQLYRSLLTDPDFSRTRQLWDRIDVALVGVGAPPTILQGYGPAHVTKAYEALARAVGDVSSHYFDLFGEAVPYEGEERLVGVTREQLHAARLVVGLAVGEEKAISIIGAARARLVNAIVTDITTADCILANLGEGGGIAP